MYLMPYSKRPPRRDNNNVRKWCYFVGGARVASICENTPLEGIERDEHCYGKNFFVMLCCCCCHLLWRHLPENWQLFLHQKINQKKRKTTGCKKNFPRSIIQRRFLLTHKTSSDWLEILPFRNAELLNNETKKCCIVFRCERNQWIAGRGKKCAKRG